MSRMTTGRILVVDDNRNVLKALEILLQFEFENIRTLKNPNQIPSVLEKEDFDLVLLDMNFSAGVNTGNEGLYWLDQINSIDPSLSVVLITAFGDVELAVNAIKKGATDFVLKPWDNQKLMATCHAALELSRTKRKLSDLEDKQKAINEDLNQTHQSIVGYSAPLMKVVGMVRKVAKTDVNVLITGENGTGKELIAREIHRLSSRSGMMLVSLDIGSLTESLFEDELFGHKKGAFTDAYDDRVGKIETAHGGTLFIDEIGNLPISLQSKLLSVIENRQVTRIGSNKVKPVDIRLVCATNKDLPVKVSEGSFREDLLYRINTIVIEVPPLRDRGDDILLLANFFLSKYSDKYNKGKMSINPKASEDLLHYHWPGNVRELRHTIEKAVILADSKVIQPEDLFIKASQSINMENPKTLIEMEQMMIRKTIDRYKGNISAAADELGITRQTLYNKMKKSN